LTNHNKGALNKKQMDVEYQLLVAALAQVGIKPPRIHKTWRQQPREGAKHWQSLGPEKSACCNQDEQVGSLAIHGKYHL
jgi:hypothetical protein